MRSASGNSSTEADVITLSYKPLHVNVDPWDLSLPRSKTTVVDANGTVTEYYYDYFGDRLRLVEHEPTLDAKSTVSVTTAYTYNFNMALTAVVYPEGDQVTYEYDTRNPDPMAQGNLLEVQTVPDEDRGRGTPQVTRYDYAPELYLVTAETDPLGRITTYAYDDAGNRTEERDPAGGVVRHAYDEHGFEVAVTDANGHTMTKDDYVLAPPNVSLVVTPTEGYGTTVHPGEVPPTLHYVATSCASGQTIREVPTPVTKVTVT
ncbi:MAG TPA: hypothetical protein EYP04_08155 [Anaerolineae bacterium]|nr:hypothetical protein [Anaerolineae bacterium]HIQ06447.1 hypothetical protein [Anaerolineae bacterium]